MKTLIIATSALFLLTSCASAVRGTTQAVSVSTNPAGAKISFSNGQSCISPCQIQANRKEALTVTATKAGCPKVSTTLTPKLSTVGFMIGGYADYETGGVFDLTPNPVALSMACK